MENVTEFKKSFVLWTVKDMDYKLKLTTSTITEIEAKLNGNLLKILDAGLPSLSVMALLIHGALQKYNHGLRMSDVKDLLDDYFDEGGSQLDLLQKVIIPIFQVSGFFSPKMVQAMNVKMKEVEEKMEQTEI